MTESATKLTHSEEGLVKTVLRILSLSEGAHRRKTELGFQAFRDAVWGLDKPQQEFVGALYHFGKEFHGSDDEVLREWGYAKGEAEEAGKWICPHIINDPMIEVYLVRALGILQSEGIIKAEAGVERE